MLLIDDAAGAAMNHSSSIVQRSRGRSADDQARSLHRCAMHASRVRDKSDVGAPEGAAGRHFKSSYHYRCIVALRVASVTDRRQCLALSITLLVADLR